MTATINKTHRDILMDIARRAMGEQGLLAEYPIQALEELGKMCGPAPAVIDAVPDLTDMLWCSIDNDDSRDLDQLTAADRMNDGSARVRVAIADVDEVVRKSTVIDSYARNNTATIYTAAGNFPMLPERISTDLTSLNKGEDHLAVVVEMILSNDGGLQNYSVYRALVRNRAKLAYNSLAAWLDGNGPLPGGIAEIEGMAQSLRLQDELARKLRTLRHLHGALDLETIQSRPLFERGMLMNIECDVPNRAEDIIEDFMIAANGITARYLEAKKFSSLRRMVSKPKRWDRIVTIASALGTTLPQSPDPAALELFLVSSKKRDPVRFPDLSLSIVKLLGSGEYVVQECGKKKEGHFGLAVKDYSHSTAPNRRFPDLITQRLIKAAFAGDAPPYGLAELSELAVHCTETEDKIKKVERLVDKAAAGLLLQGRTGMEFDGIITGASPKGTWVRIFDPPAEGKLESGFDGLDVGERVRVKLVSTNIVRGFIDFARVR